LQSSSRTSDILNLETLTLRIVEPKANAFVWLANGHPNKSAEVIEREKSLCENPPVRLSEKPNKMKNFDTRVYSVSDFLEWDSNGLLNLSPDFQRRSVWKEKAKSYLIDTLLRGKPIPKILITQELEGRRNIRMVIDGQQRLRSILEFINGDFKISRAHNKDFAGRTFNTLPEAVRQEFLSYELGVDVLFGLSYEEMLDIFSRLNTYTVKLNEQEQFNAKYLGFYKQMAYALGYRYVQYFLGAGFLTKATVTRMAEAALAADLLMALVGGVQTNKNIEQYYINYEDEIGPLERAENHFDSIMTYIGSLYSAEEIAQTNWSRIHLFYTLFTSIAHMLFGLEGLNPKLRAKISKSSLGKIRVRLDQISSRYDEIAADLESSKAPADYKTFIDFSRRRTTDTAARIYRAEFLCKQIQKAIS
jgi:hypothetical protein